MEIITNTFPKHPSETKLFPVSFAEVLAAYGDTLQPVTPFELGPVPDGIVIESQAFDAVLARLTLLVSGGTDGRYYTLKMWINTVKGQRLEHQVYFQVKEERR